ncbi:ribosome hibernation-promoting factor, HPF/YfiA family [Subtercola boreus]|uniref:Ribosome hibernation promoting factor n=1 Tax=Subtercola boreus TaxID=120213 RepID=A0A3E0WCX9_9MICO|nr:ribosome-associated translation inhibitor RaiA [Subtercola boreus]RFA22673.1 ribosomal subunit interface protein [Subtercola boreus]RFA23028.1 ribosomal subunit interface protein [Subtercola boreus]RFA28780.1 ribosomal subunit interface protein [Subtercola boreus]
MEINITGRNLGITDRFRSYATEKAEKVSHLADRALALEVKVCRHSSANTSGGDDRVELTLIGPGPIVRAESAGSDKYVAFDLAIAKLLERIRRAKDRKKVHRGQHRPVSLREAAAADFTVTDLKPAESEVLERATAGGPAPETAEAGLAAAGSGVDEIEEAWSPVVIRKKVFAAAPMTVDDALYLMELVGHDFYLFIDAETHRPSVVYRRKGWDYGVIGLDDSASPLVDEAREAERVLSPAS